MHEERTSFDSVRYGNIFKNAVLNSLSSDVLKRLDLRPLLFPLLHEIEFPGSLPSSLYFVETGMASMTTTFQDGSQVEVASFGCEAVIGIPSLLGTNRSLNRVYTLITGTGYTCPTRTALNEFRRGELFQTIALRNMRMQLIQTSQTAGCNARHNLEQRLARWLLICADRTNQRRFPVSHDILADMLGSTRPTISVMANILKQAGLIEYSRGVVMIRDFEGLEARACECYKIISNYFDDYVEFDRGRST
jgi:CRP-like cAMP-binding protein